MSAAAGRAWYRAYLRSPRWRILRLVARLLARGRCRRCGRRPSRGNWLEVHHTDYAYTGRPGLALLWELQALEVLCAMCHGKEHE